MDFTHFNPLSQKEEDFLANFVARRDVLDYFLRQLRLLEPTRPANHHLIIAPRGYGKTTLLRRVAIATRTDKELKNRVIALSFREEQHNVISLDVFWRNCLQSLLEVREDEKGTQEEIARLDAAWEKHAPRQSLKRDDQDGEPAKHEFFAHCEHLGRRPLLLIDNFDALLAGLSENHQWSLRNDLQSSGGPMLIAAASRYPESTHDQKSAFYDFFRIQTLDKLSDDEVLQCLRIRAEHRSEAGRRVLSLIDKNPGRVAALNTLAGGNPRTLSVLYSVLESHANTDVLSQLSAMLDTFTGWYQSRTEELPLQSRAVFDALALNWDPMTAAALGEATGLDTTLVSSQLSRLEKSGYVESISLSEKKKGRNGYQVSERFFNIWYLMRNGPRRVRESIKFLAVFLQSCFSPRERQSIAREILEDIRADPSYALALASSLRVSRLRNQLLEHANTQSMRLGKADEYGSAIQDLRKTTSIQKNVKARENESASGSKGLSSHVRAAEALFKKGLKFNHLGKSMDAIAVYKEIVKRFGESSEAALQEPVAMALINQGISLSQIGRFEDEIAVYDNLLKRFVVANEAAFPEQVAIALVNKAYALGQLDRSSAELAVYDEVVALFGEASKTELRVQVARALNNKGVRLGQLDLSAEAIAIYDMVVERFDKAKESALQEQVAIALFSKGVRFGALEKLEDSIAVYNELVERFGEDKETALREQVAKTLFNKGMGLGRLGRWKEALAAYDDLIKRFGEAKELAFRKQVAMALVSKGFTLGMLDNTQDEIAVYDNVVDRFGEAKEWTLRNSVGRALFNKAITLGQLGNLEDEIAVYEKIVERLDEAQESELQIWVAMAHFNKGVRLGHLGKSEGEIASYDQVIERFGETNEATLREQVAMSLVNKGSKLGQLGKSEEAIAVYDTVVERFGEAKEVALREQVAKALSNKGTRLVHLGKLEDAIASYDKFIDRFGEAKEAAMRERIAKAIINKGVTLGKLGKIQDEVSEYDKVVKRFGDAKEVTVREQVAIALINRGITLDQRGNAGEAILEYDNVVDRFAEDKDFTILEKVAKALLYKGDILGRQPNSTDAIAVYDKIVEQFGESTETALRELVAVALTNKSISLGKLGKTEDEIAAYDELVERFGEAKEVELREQVARALNTLGNLFVDKVGDPTRARQAYENGLSKNPSENVTNMLHSNLAYVLALHTDNLPAALVHMTAALADEAGISASGRDLLQTLAALDEPPAKRWQNVFEHIVMAVERGDQLLWTDYVDDLQRLLWFVVVQGKGHELRQLMETKRYPVEFAPLYHAFVAAIEDADHLLKVNPETRQAAMPIYEGLAKRLRLYPKT